MDYGIQFQVNPPNIETDDYGNISLVSKVATKMVENIDDAVCTEIIKAAREAGVTDLILMDKTNILKALQNYSPVKPIPEDISKCSVCMTPVHEFDNFCSNCGQRIDWNKEEEN